MLLSLGGPGASCSLSLLQPLLCWVDPVSDCGCVFCFPHQRKPSGLWMVWLKVVTTQEKLGGVDRCCEVNSGIIQVQVCLREQCWLRLTTCGVVWTCWSLLSRMCCVCPDSWDSALSLGSDKQLSSYSLDLAMPPRCLASY